MIVVLVTVIKCRYKRRKLHLKWLSLLRLLSDDVLTAANPAGSSYRQFYVTFRWSHSGSSDIITIFVFHIMFCRQQYVPADCSMCPRTSVCAHRQQYVPADCTMCPQTTLCARGLQYVPADCSMCPRTAVRVCGQQCVSADSSMCLQTAVCVCRQQCVSADCSICLQTAVCICRQQCVSADSSMCLQTAVCALKTAVCVCRQQCVLPGTRIRPFVKCFPYSPCIPCDTTQVPPDRNSISQ